MTFNHILHVVNAFSDEEIEQLKTIYAYLKAKGFSFKISLLYIHSPSPNHYFHFPHHSAEEHHHEELAKKELQKIGKQFGIDNEDCWIAHGTPASQALKLAKNVKATTILVSKHLMRQFKNQHSFSIKTVANIAMV